MATAEEKELACLPEAMRSCPTVGGCDLTSRGKEELPPHRWGMTPAAITRAPCRPCTAWGPEGGRGEPFGNTCHLCLLPPAPPLSLLPREVGCSWDRASSWVPPWLCLEPGATSSHTPGAPAAPRQHRCPQSASLPCALPVLISAGAHPAFGAPSSSPAAGQPVPSACLMGPSGSPSGSISLSPHSVLIKTHPPRRGSPSPRADRACVCVT